MFPMLLHQTNLFFIILIERLLAAEVTDHVLKLCKSCKGKPKTLVEDGLKEGIRPHLN